MLHTNLIIRALDSLSEAANELEREVRKAGYAFNRKEIYPHLGKLIFTLRDLRFVGKYQSDIQAALKKGTDLTAIEVVKKLVEQKNVTLLKIKERIKAVLGFIEWAVPLVQKRIEQGDKLYDDIENSLVFQWDNLSSAKKCRGFIFLNIASDSSDEIKVYYCHFERLVNKISQKTNWSINIKWHKNVLPNSPDIVKKQVLNSRSTSEKIANPNPATVWVTALERYPLSETLEPILQRRFISGLLNKIENKQS